MKTTGMSGSIAAELQTIKSSNLYRRLRREEHISPTRAVIDGFPALLFAGNDYLGIGSHPAPADAALDAIRSYGTSSGASRLISGNCQLYEALERAIASFKNKESALVFPSGYMTNVGVLSALAEARDVIYMDRLNHASLYDGARLSGSLVHRYRHRDLDHLTQLIKKNGRRYRRRFIVTDGVFSMDGDIAPLPELRRISDDHDCLLLVDDAHGTGVIGPGGCGSAAHFGVEPDIEIGTLSKALGNLGGYAAGDSEVVDYLVNKSRPFIFTTALPPATLAAACCALDVIKKEEWRRARVLNLATRARTALKESGFSVIEGFTPIIPIVIGDEERALQLSASLLQKGIFIPAVRTPAVPKNQARLRMTVSAVHTDDDLDTAVSALVLAGKELNLL